MRIQDNSSVTPRRTDENAGAEMRRKGRDQVTACRYLEKPVRGSPATCRLMITQNSIESSHLYSASDPVPVVGLTSHLLPATSKEKSE